MWHRYLSAALIVSFALLGDAARHGIDAGASRLAADENSPVYKLNLRSYKWSLPEFRMAGNDAYAVVRVENTNDYELRMHVDCRTDDGQIPQMTGDYRIEPGGYMHMDTRRMGRSHQKGKGVRVTCRFRANHDAKVEAWVYDDKVRKADAGARISTRIDG